MKKQVNPKIEKETYNFMSQTFKSADAGLTHAIESFPFLYNKALSEIKGLFTRGELYLIIDVFNGLTLTSQNAGEHLLEECSKEIDIDKLDIKWRVDKDGLEQKINALTSFQTACVEIWANVYWHGGGANSTNDKTDRDLENHIELLL